MRLTELDPKWWAEPGRRGQGVVFLCPHCRKTWLCVAFSNPLDGGHPWSLSPSPRPLWAVLYPDTLARGQVVVPPGTHWHRTGDTFDTLTLAPSVDASPAGCWHGFVRAGGVA